MSLPKTQRSYAIPTDTPGLRIISQCWAKAVINGVVMAVTPKSGLDLYGVKP